MKQTKLIFVLTFVISLIISCNNDNQENNIQNDESTSLTLERIENNYNLSYDLFEEMQSEVPTSSIIELRDAASTKDIFLDEIDNASIEIFPNTVEAMSSSFVLDYIPMPFAGDAKETLKANLNHDEPSIDVIEEYSEAIFRLAEQQNAADNGHMDWIVIETPSTGSGLPPETITMNFEKVVVLINIYNILINPNFSDEEIINQIDELLIENETPPRLAALLLPAVQAARDSSSSTPFETALTDWLNTNVDPAISGGLSRDITRRIQATAYLAGLHALLLENFPNNKADMVSLSVLHARYRAAILMSASEMWDHR